MQAFPRLPAIVELPFGWQLLRSDKGDCYYMTNRDRCSCPLFQRQRTCKHVGSLRQAEIAAHIIDLHDTRSGEVLYWRGRILEGRRAILSRSCGTRRKIFWMQKLEEAKGRSFPKDPQLQPNVRTPIQIKLQKGLL